jgi:dienelactone hydrolase
VEGRLAIGVAAFAACVSAAPLVARGDGNAARGVPTLHVTPAQSLEDQPLHIRVTGLAAREKTLISMRSTDSTRVVWTSSATFRANADGIVDVNRASAAAGRYTGVWGMGLLSSMGPVGAAPYGAYFWNGPQKLRFDITARAAGRPAAKLSVWRRFSARAIGRRSASVQSEGFSGVFWAPSRSTRSPALLIFGGSEGGLSTYLLGAALAAHGYPTLALAYFGAPDLPQTLQRIPLDYFAKALNWLRAQPHVDASRIAVLGISRGSEAALLLGVHYPELVHAVIASVPTNVSNCGIHGPGSRSCEGPAWTLGGKALPYTNQFGNPAPTDQPAAVIPVEKIHGPVFVDCAGQDDIWPSCTFAHAIIARLDAHHDAYAHELWAAPGASHFAGALMPYEPIASTDPAFEANERGRETLWPHLLQFLAALRRP